MVEKITLGSGLVTVDGIIIAVVLYYFNNVVGGVIAGSLGVLGILIAVGTYFALNPGKIEQWKSLLFKAWSYFDESKDKYHVQKDVESVINSFDTSDLGYEIDTGLSIEWETDPDRESILDDGQVIICLDSSDYQSENVAKAAFEYSKHGIIRSARRHLAETVDEGLNYCLSQAILNNSGRADSVSILYEDIILPKLEEMDEMSDNGDNPLRKSFEDIEMVRKGGFLGPVLLREFEKLTDWGVPKNEIKEETKELVEFLEDIASRDSGETGDLCYHGKYIDLCVGLMAKTYVDDNNLERYSKMAKMNLSKANTSYIMAVGGNIESAKKVVNETKGLPGVESYEEINYKLDGDSRFGAKKAYCCKFEKDTALRSETITS